MGSGKYHIVLENICIGHPNSIWKTIQFGKSFFPVMEIGNGVVAFNLATSSVLIFLTKNSNRLTRTARCPMETPAVCQVKAVWVDSPEASSLPARGLNAGDVSEFVQTA